MQKIILILTLSLCCISCKNNNEDNTKTETSFNKEKWIIKEKEDYPYRDSMLDDLISNGKLKTLNKASVIDFLGEPNRIDNNYLFYLIAQERIQSWPLHTKTLVIKLKDDGTVEWVKIHE